jgi:hypothetical protein
MGETIIGLLSITIIIFIYTILWKKYCVDNFRENLFEIRSNLFNLACSGAKGFNFNHSLYISFENALNGSIKVATEVSLLELLPVTYFIKKNKISLENTLATNLLMFKSYCDNTKLISTIDELKKNYDNAIIKYLWGSSVFVGTSLISILFIKHALKSKRIKLTHNLKYAFDIPVSEFENQAQNIIYPIAA